MLKKKVNLINDYKFLIFISKDWKESFNILHRCDQSKRVFSGAWRPRLINDKGPWTQSRKVSSLRYMSTNTDQPKLVKQ